MDKLQTVNRQLQTTNYQLRTTNHQRPSVLIVSNGHAEDAVGMALASMLTGHVDVTAYPLVGNGYVSGDIPLLEPRRILPSGGFGLRGGWKALWADVRAGGLGFWRRQRDTLRNQRGQHTLVVAVGDVYCLWMAGHVGTTAVFIATAKSEFNEAHRWWERRMVAQLARVVYTRDEVTAGALRRWGIAAKYVGNPLMDIITSTGEALRLHLDLATIALLPGSRAEAPRNLMLLLRACTRIWQTIQVNMVCALAPTTDLQAIVEAVAEEGWSVGAGLLRSPSGEVVLTRNFGEALSAADVVLGLAGTANEQAAGLGKPVVAFPGPGPQYTRRFMALQQRLLGDALVSTPGWREAADAVVRLLSDQDERRGRGESGRLRMGPPGAVQRIAAELAAMLATGAE